VVIRIVRLVLTLSVAAGLVWLARRALIRWVEGPPVEPSAEPWPEVDDLTDLARTGPSPRYAVAEHGPRVGSAQARIRPPAMDEAQGPAAAGNGSLESWVAPGADGCPATHPVKVKLSSRLYHLPGMSAYARTNPDRCYASPEAAEADGFAPAKR
jgi:hypothetical protein